MKARITKPDLAHTDGQLLVIFLYICQPAMFRIALLFLVLTACMSKNQKALQRFQKAQTDTMNTPYWIAMMNDSNANYYSTISAFELFWKNKARPVRDQDNEGRNIFGNDTAQDMQNGEYVMEYKQYLHWKQTSQNLVKPDGKVMTPFEIQRMIKTIKDE